MGVFASQSPGFHDDLLLVDSTPVECARSRETVKRSAAGADAADYGYCAIHCRYFWGFRLHALFAPDGTPRACAHLARSRRARRRPRAARPLPTHGQRDPDRRQGLRRPRVRSPPSATSTPRSSGPAAKTNPATARTSPRSANGSSRSSRPAKTSSPSNATAPAPCTASERILSARFARPRRRDHPQPPTRTPQPRARRLHRLTAWNQPSSRAARRRGA